jgi:hypothetical protein
VSVVAEQQQNPIISEFLEIWIAAAAFDQLLLDPDSTTHHIKPISYFINLLYKSKNSFAQLP